MAVVDRSGWVHLFRLPGEAAGADLPWPEYGHDPGNTFNATTSRSRGRDGGGRDESTRANAAIRAMRIGPNPLRQTAVISFSAVETEPVQLSVFDAQGRCIKRLIDRRIDPGVYNVAWDGRDDSGMAMPPGIYIMRLTRPDAEEVKKIVVIR